MSLDVRVHGDKHKSFKSTSCLFLAYTDDFAYTLQKLWYPMHVDEMQHPNILFTGIMLNIDIWM